MPPCGLHASVALRAGLDTAAAPVSAATTAAVVTGSTAQVRRVRAPDDRAPDDRAPDESEDLDCIEAPCGTAGLPASTTDGPMRRGCRGEHRAVATE